MSELPPPLPDQRRGTGVSLMKVVGIALVALVAVPCVFYLKWRFSNTSAVLRLQQVAHARHEPDRKSVV